MVKFTEDLLQKLNANEPKYSKIDLFDEAFAETQSQQLTSALLSNTQVRQLILGNRTLTFNTMESLLLPLANHPSLTVLEISDAQLGASVGKLLGNFLQQNRMLKKLNLAKNQLGGAGAKMLAEGLAQNRGLLSLELADNKIGTEGAKALGQMLSTNQWLSALDISRNAVGDAGLALLSQGLQTNPVLFSLKLTQNDLTDNSLITLNGALRKNKILTSLDLTGAAFTEAGIEKLRELIGYNTSLREIILDKDLSEGIKLEYTCAGVTDLFCLMCCCLSTFLVDGNSRKAYMDVAGDHHLGTKTGMAIFCLPCNLVMVPITTLGVGYSFCADSDE